VTQRETRPATRDRILAIDLGTTAVKAAVMDETAGVIAVASSAQRTLGDESGRREHVPAQTWRAVQTAVREAVGRAGDAAAIRAVSVTGPRGTFEILGTDGRPRTNFLTWQDRRAAGTAATIAADPPDGYRATTGAAPDPSSVLPKLLWLRDQQPDSFGDGWRIAPPQTDVLARLGADGLVVDLSVAAHVGLLDVTALTWSSRLLGAFDVPAEALPRLVAPGAQVG
jgi:sugar (pentulose or hexulose) kinase